MSIRLVGILFLFLSITSCKKNDNNNSCGFTTSTAVAPASEVANLKLYLDTNNIAATQHPSGFFYAIHTQGSGTIPNVCSVVTVKYTGKLTNGSVFDSSNPNYPGGVTFTLGQLISGWQIGIPLIQPGGSITLYIPPSLGYGSQGAGSAIPPNSNLIFDIDLVNVQ